MTDDLLADPPETGLLGQYRYETVHLAVYLDALTTFRRYAFRPQLKSCSRMPRRQPGRRLEKFARQRLAQRIVPLLLPPR